MENQLLKELILYIGPDYTPDQDSFLLLLINDAIEEVCNEMFPYGFSSDEEKEKNFRLMEEFQSKAGRLLAFAHKEVLFGRLHSTITISKEKKG